METVNLIFVVIAFRFLVPLIDDVTEGDPELGFLLQVLRRFIWKIDILDHVLASGLNKRQRRWLENLLFNHVFFFEGGVATSGTLINQVNRWLVSELKALIVVACEHDDALMHTVEQPQVLQHQFCEPGLDSCDVSRKTVEDCDA